MNNKFLYRIVHSSVDDERKKAFMKSINYRLSSYYILPTNEKLWSFKRFKEKNHLTKHEKKTSYNWYHIIRGLESDRMETIRKNGIKKVRYYLKNESKRLINEFLNK